MEGVNLFRGVRGTPYLDPRRGCYLRRILGGNHYNPHYGVERTRSTWRVILGGQRHASTRKSVPAVIEIRIL